MQTTQGKNEIICKCGFSVLYIAIRERRRDKEKRARASERSYKGDHKGGCVCLRASEG